MHIIHLNIFANELGCIKNTYIFKITSWSIYQRNSIGRESVSLLINNCIWCNVFIDEGLFLYTWSEGHLQNKMRAHTHESLVFTRWATGLPICGWSRQRLRKTRTQVRVLANGKAWYKCAHFRGIFWGFEKRPT